jgi:hypothetical protein
MVNFGASQLNSSVLRTGGARSGRNNRAAVDGGAGTTHRGSIGPSLVEWGRRPLRGPVEFTALQGQYLAYIHTYTLLHRRPPAEADMREFFQVTSPTVHNMVLTLEARGLIERVPGKARSLRVLVPARELPGLQPPPKRSGV